MSKLKSALGRAYRSLRPRRYYTEPDAYWEQRHQRFGANLEGVGRLHLSEADNQAAYEAKWDHIGPTVAALGPPGRLLDAGCGIGWFTQRFVDAGHQVTAFDFTATGIAVARERVSGAVAWEVADLAGFRSDEAFAVVTCIDVLFHVVDDAVWTASVRNLRDLAAGGHLVVQEHLVPHAEASRPVTPDGTFHTRWRSLEQYQQALADATLVSHQPYVVAGEGAAKDLLVFAVPASS